MNLTLSDVENILRSELKRYRNMELYRERWEDGIQEGLIRAWKDMDEGTYDHWYVVNRAKYWAKVYILNSDGKRYMTGHIPGSKHHTNPHIKPLLHPDGKVNHHAYAYRSFDEQPVEFSPELHSATAIPSFEEDLLSELAFQEMVADLKPEDQKALYLRHVVGSSTQEIADHLGVKFSAAASRRLIRAHKKLEESL